MNARTAISAPPASRNYVEHYADYSGQIKKPVLTLHTVIDDIVPVAHESAYRQTVAAAGRSDLLVQAYGSRVGHCNLSAAQVLTAVHALDTWLDKRATAGRPNSRAPRRRRHAARSIAAGAGTMPWPTPNRLSGS
jgi:dienelactone hydrolase